MIATPATKVRSTSRSGMRLVWVVALVVTVGACDPATIAPAPRPVNAIIEFQALLAPAGADPELVLAMARAAAEGIDREFGVDLSRKPDVLEYGVAGCIEARWCLGADIGPGPWTVWHIRWQPDAQASWIALLLEPATERFIWIGAG